MKKTYIVPLTEIQFFLLPVILKNSVTKIGGNADLVWGGAGNNGDEARTGNGLWDDEEDLDDPSWEALYDEL